MKTLADKILNDLRRCNTHASVLQTTKTDFGTETVICVVGAKLRLSSMFLPTNRTGEIISVNVERLAGEQLQAKILVNSW